MSGFKQIILKLECALEDRLRCRSELRFSPLLTLNLKVSFGENWLTPEDPYVELCIRV